MIKKAKANKKSRKSFFIGIKNLSVLEIGFIKWSVFFFTLFIVSLLSENAIVIIKNLKWIWFILFVLLAIKPLKKSFKK